MLLISVGDFIDSAIVNYLALGLLAQRTQFSYPRIMSNILAKILSSSLPKWIVSKQFFPIPKYFEKCNYRPDVTLGHMSPFNNADSSCEKRSFFYNKYILHITLKDKEVHGVVVGVVGS